jgi:hypothetical protein
LKTGLDHIHTNIHQPDFAGNSDDIWFALMHFTFQRKIMIYKKHSVGKN